MFMRLNTAFLFLYKTETRFRTNIFGPGVSHKMLECTNFEKNQELEHSYGILKAGGILECPNFFERARSNGSPR